MKKNDQPWTMNSNSEVLTFTYDRSFEKHPERQRVLDELNSYAQAIGLTKVHATQYGGAVINACHALESAPGCHFKFAKPEEGGGVSGIMLPLPVCSSKQVLLSVMCMETLSI